MDFKEIMRPVRFGKGPAQDDVPRPLIRPQSANRRLAALREAGEVLAVLPGPGESLHAIMTGRYDLTDTLEVLLDRLGTIQHMRIATLSFNRHNVKLLTSWVDAGRVRELTLLCSLFFVEHNPELAEEFRQVLPRAHFAASRNHCKVCCLSFAEGERRKLSLEGSANLRTNSNREQFCLVADPDLHDWHAAWIDTEVSRNENDTSRHPATG
jgi:hypothetical protein